MPNIWYSGRWLSGVDALNRLAFRIACLRAHTHFFAVIARSRLTTTDFLKMDERYKCTASSHSLGCGRATILCAWSISITIQPWFSKSREKDEDCLRQNHPEQSEVQASSPIHTGPTCQSWDQTLSCAAQGRRSLWLAVLLHQNGSCGA